MVEYFRLNRTVSHSIDSTHRQLINMQIGFIYWTEVKRKFVCLLSKFDARQLNENYNGTQFNKIK